MSKIMNAYFDEINAQPEPEEPYDEQAGIEIEPESKNEPDEKPF